MSRYNKKFLKLLMPSIIILFLIIPVFAQVIPVFAQDQNPPPDDTGNNPSPITVTIVNPFRERTIQGLINVIVNDILMPVGGVIAVIMIMYAGFLYVTARGSEAQIKKAHNALLYAVIGAAILLGAWAISQAIQATITQLRG